MKKSEIKVGLFGASDGLLAAVAIVFATSSRGRVAVLLALFGLFVAEGLGMAASQYLSDPDTSVKDAELMGASTAASILLVGLPWGVVGGATAIVASLVLAISIGAAIAQLRPGGWTTWLQTFGVLAPVAGIAAAGGHL